LSKENALISCFFSSALWLQPLSGLSVLKKASEIFSLQIEAEERVCAGSPPAHGTSLGKEKALRCGAKGLKCA